MKYIIHQKSIQTDYYEVEAESVEAALQTYRENLGTLESQGSTSGWTFKEAYDIVAVNSENPKDKGAE